MAVIPVLCFYLHREPGQHWDQGAHSAAVISLSVIKHHLRSHLQPPWGRGALGRADGACLAALTPELPPSPAPWLAARGRVPQCTTLTAGNIPQHPIPYSTPSHTAPHPIRHPIPHGTPSRTTQPLCAVWMLTPRSSPSSAPDILPHLLAQQPGAGLPSWNKKCRLTEINPAVPTGQRAAALGSDLGSQTDSPPEVGRTELSDPGSLATFTQEPEIAGTWERTLGAACRSRDTAGTSLVPTPLSPWLQHSRRTPPSWVPSPLCVLNTTARTQPEAKDC